MSTASNTTRQISPVIKILLAAGAVFFGALIAMVFFAFDPTKAGFFPPCLFHELTGLDCPGCGAQRALHELLHGHIIAALRLNLMFVLSLPLLAWFGPLWTWRAWHKQPVLTNPKWLYWYGIAWVAFGFLRNLPVPVFAWFFAA